MKRLYTLTIVILLILTLLPGYANAGAAAFPEASAQAAALTPPVPILSLALDQYSELYREYTVKRGDSLISIGRQFKVPWRDLAILNGIGGPKYTVTNGQTLKIPLLPKLPGTTGNYLILCENEAQKQCLAEFAAYKILNGYSVTIKSVEADVKLKADADTSEEIRQYLKKMDKVLSLEFVLLVGSAYDEESACIQHTGGAIPLRYMYDNPANRDYSWYDGKNHKVFKTPTDIYYALDLNWDFDEDGFAGERNEMAESVKQAEPKLLFRLGRIPFSDSKDIKKVLDSTMQYEISQKAHSDALIGSYGIWAYYSDALANNFSNMKIKAVSLYGNDENGPCQYKSTYPLSIDNFFSEINKKYDFVYIMGDIKKYCGNTPLGKRVQAGIYFLDGTATMQAEPEPKYSRFNAQDFLAEGSACTVIATTEEVGFNPKNPVPRITSRLFSNKMLSISGEFYAAVLSSIMEDDVREAYVYCYLGDPSIALKQ